jgi:hypothetical protein
MVFALSFGASTCARDGRSMKNPDSVVLSRCRGQVIAELLTIKQTGGCEPPTETGSQSGAKTR